MAPGKEPRPRRRATASGALYELGAAVTTSLTAKQERA
jgi:hypothetical protein